MMLRMAAGVAILTLGATVACPVACAAEGAPPPPMEIIEDPLPWPEANAGQQVRMALSRFRYHAEDGHLDVILERVREDPHGDGDAPGTVTLTIAGGDGVQLYTSTWDAPADIFVCYPPIPPKLVGATGVIEAVWTVPGQEAGRSSANFRVQAPAGNADRGRVRLHIPNPTGATVRGLPQTVGVPFPRGALREEANVRLVDDSGREVPLQTVVTSRWSRFGPIRWLQCDLTVTLSGGPLDLFVEFGPDVSRSSQPGLPVDPAAGAIVPAVETGTLRLGATGMEGDPAGRGSYRALLDNPDLTGAFVEREDGRRYAMPSTDPLKLEEQGNGKVVLARSGWYANPQDPDDRFCQYVTRYIVHHRSPLLRVFHTWIYTGDANEERIRDMGWQFNTAPGLSPQGILTEFGDAGEWAPGEYLVQHDFDKADIADESGQVREEQLRAPGVISVAGNGMRLYLGVKDFWQNYPREIEFTDGATILHEWPRHGRTERRLTTPENKMRLWFAHEGEGLDFRMPKEYGEAQIHAGLRHEQYWPAGQPEAVNAQGVAKTTEFWLYLTDEQTSAQEAEKVLQGLNDETLRAVVDPTWVAASGAFYEMHPEDREHFPEDEATYELHALAPMVWAERMRIYGKWVWGNMLWSPSLETQTAGIYRGFRKAHQGWPYSWLPYARSGDARYLKFAEAATRTMTDVNFCHYSDEKTGHRPRGEWYRGALPWTGSGRGRPYTYPPGPGPVTRGYSEQCNYQLRCWLLTGYRRAKDVIEDWAALVKTHYAEDGSVLFPYATAPNSRRTANLLKTYVEMYDQTHDPWFIMAAHVLAHPIEPWETWRMHFWQPGNREYHRFTGSEEMERFYVEKYAPEWTDPVKDWGGWRSVVPQMEQPAYAWRLTGDEQYLKRIAGWLTLTRVATYDGEPDYRRGTMIYGIGNLPFCYTGYYLQQFPAALAAIADSGEDPEPVSSAFYQAPATVEKTEDGAYEWKMPTIALSKRAGQTVPLRLQVNVGNRPPEGQIYRYTVTGPGGETVLEGSWDITAEETAILPAEAAAGTYRVHVTGIDTYAPYASSNVNHTRCMRGLRVPLSPPGVPEVVEFDPEEGLGSSFWYTMYWTRVPEDCAQFEVQFSLQTKDRYPATWAAAVALNRVGVWDPDGQLQWMEQHLIEQYDGPDTVTAQVAVPREQRGRMWLISAPGWSRGIRPGPELPPQVAVTPERWFTP